MAMRLVGQIDIYVSGSVINREPTFLEKIKRGLGGKVDLSTDQMKVELEATAVVDQTRRALGRLGVSNALSLIIDDTVIFQDTDGKADDLPDLVLALSEHASVFGRGFKELRFGAEHEEAGLHLVIETRARTKHRADEPAAVVSIGGRLRALEPRSGESAETYRARVEPITKDTTAFETARMQFESFVSRFEDALRAAMPEARVEQRRAEARLVKPAATGVQPQPPRDPAHPAYDPYLAYYPPSPMSVMLDFMILSSLMHAFMPPAHIMVVNTMGAPIGSVADVAQNPERLEAADDNQGDQGHDDGGDEAHDQDHDADSDYGDTAYDDAGGDVGGGDDWG
jgi:hypothetical protein